MRFTEKDFFNLVNQLAHHDLTNEVLDGIEYLLNSEGTEKGTRLYTRFTKEHVVLALATPETVASELIRFADTLHRETIEELDNE